MEGLKIKTVSGTEFEVHGVVTYNDFPEGRVYYCGGQSWPEEIVTAHLGRLPDYNDDDRHKMYA